MSVNKPDRQEKILIVEDAPGLRDFLSRLLTHEGYMVLTAPNGEHGLHRALEEQPNMILMDSNMPKMDGLEVVQALREQDCHIPVILMTVFGSEEIILKALRLGVRDYLSKPFSPDDLLRAIEQALASQRWRQQQEQLARQQAALKAMEQLIVTVAHHVNNPLQALALGTETIKDLLQQQPSPPHEPTMQRSLAMIEDKIDEIAAVVEILRQSASLPTTFYQGQIEMLDIGRALKQRLLEKKRYRQDH